MSHLIKHIENSLNLADRYQSKISKDILDIDGMSGIKTRHFYNNICSVYDARYLEIGPWKGSSVCSAMCNNKMTCVCIDNWSESGGPMYIFLNNFNRCKGANNATFIEQDCWNVNINDIGKFNIYMYDGNYTESSCYHALNCYLPCLDNEFIYLVNDWNHTDIVERTLSSIKGNNLNILYQKEILTRSNSSDNDWSNGISVFVLQKS